MIKHITEMIVNSDNDKRVFPATEFYNENWMLRLVLFWCSLHPHNKLLVFNTDARWFTEGKLPTPFKARSRTGDKQSERRTEVDGIIGHIQIESGTRTGLAITKGAKQLVVLESKMQSGFRRSVTNAKNYNQAARTIACMAKMFNDANHILQLKSLAYILVAPKIRIDKKVFEQLIDKENVKHTIHTRVDEYGDNLTKQWYSEVCLTLIDVVNISQLTWEDIIDSITQQDNEYGTALNEYYMKCKTYNYVK
jgi:hypothetical protein